DPIAGNAMRGFFVDADTRRARKIVRKPRCRARTVLLQQALTYQIEFPCRHAGFRDVEHVLQHQRNDPADALESDDVVLGFNGHVNSLCRLADRATAPSVAPAAACPAGKQALSRIPIWRSKCATHTFGFSS